MQIDFHHGVTYCMARLAGFSDREAEIVAYSSQYVDDATNGGTIRFEDNISLFERISSAHKMLDYRNFEELANHRVWIPFHFLPGNGGLPAGQDPQGADLHNVIVNKLICRPNSHVAQDMVRECIKQQHRPYGLHRLGIAMHVYADTWAHQGFVGIEHPINKAERPIVDADGNPDLLQQQKIERFYAKSWREKMQQWGEKAVNLLANRAISEAMPLGHGAVLSYPDRPFLQWGYTNGLGEKIRRDNPSDFLMAAEQMYLWMVRYRQGDPDANVPKLLATDRERIDRNIRSITSKDKHKRHQRWLDSIRSGEFSFGTADPVYIPHGIGAWKYQALGIETEVETGRERYLYHPNFLKTNWKLFHDALNAHRLFILQDLLPNYGLCVA